MRIISRFHDYYDSAQKHGQDNTCVYLRQRYVQYPVGIPYKEIEKMMPLLDTRQLAVVSTVVGFCGILYPCFYVRAWGTDRSATCYNVEHLVSFIDNLGDKRIKTNLEYKRKKSKRHFGRIADRYYWNRTQFTYESIGSFFEKHPPLKDDSIFFENKVPIFTCVKKARATVEFTINDCLKDLEFFKIFDPYTAYQELSMYVSGVLGVGSPETIEVSNDVLMHKRGFGDVSFKTMKGDKKPRRMNRGKQNGGQ